MAKTNDLDSAELSLLTVGLLACLVRDAKDAPTQIKVMTSLGVSSAAIARALDINPVTVRTALHRQRKGKKR